MFSKFKFFSLSAVIFLIVCLASIGISSDLGDNFGVNLKGLKNTFNLEMEHNYTSIRIDNIHKISGNTYSCEITPYLKIYGNMENEEKWVKSITLVFLHNSKLIKNKEEAYKNLNLSIESLMYTADITLTKEKQESILNRLGISNFSNNSKPVSNEVIYNNKKYWCKYSKNAEFNFGISTTGS